MVATRIMEVTSKGSEWYHSSSEQNFTPNKRNQSNFGGDTSSPSQSYFTLASNSIHQAAETAYATAADMLSSLYRGNNGSTRWSVPDRIATNNRPPRRASAPRHHSAKELVWMLKNPYNSVRGRLTHSQPSSIAAVRSLLTLVPDDTEMLNSAPEEGSETMADDEPTTEKDNETTRARAALNLNKRQVSDAETASQIAEGTIRALRDLALDEAVELNAALRFWSIRWEQPVLGWLEAGPFVWMSKEGYRHQDVGQRVAQIQAVLARRCASIGELQQHLLRAGWQKGVAQWGVIGHQGQWAAVAGFDGSMPEETRPIQRTMSSEIGDVKFAHRASSSNLSASNATTDEERFPFNTTDPKRFKNRLDDTPRTKAEKDTVNVLVRRGPGGGIFLDDPQFLAEWSVTAIALIRRQLRRASNGSYLLPYENIWRQDEVSNDGATTRALPQWVSKVHIFPLPAIEYTPTTSKQDDDQNQPKLNVSDLSLMASEVDALLNVMEEVMEIQKRRRLEKLQSPNWIRRNWYVLGTIVPSVGFFGYRLVKSGFGKDFVKDIVQRFMAFFNERVREPMVAIVTEIWKGRENFSDRKARMETIQTLKDMIRSWLDEFYPHMPVKQRAAMAEAMDVSLIEKKKEESMKTFFEINNVIRMSFIEMQYMKKEMMNALFAMDEMMSANDINMNLAAITPVVMLGYVGSRVFRFLYYALLRLGKSREEIYASFRSLLTDIERFLVMRDNPPPPPAAGEDQVATEYIKPCILSADDLGMLMLLIHECRTILWRDRRRFSPEEIRSVSEDLAELAGERGAVSVQQQLQIITRMSRTYSFLKVISTGHSFDHNILRST